MLKMCEHHVPFFIYPKNMTNNATNQNEDDAELAIIQKIEQCIDEDKNLTDADIEKMATSEIVKANYLTESWQLNYAVKRILEGIKDSRITIVPENICPNCGHEAELNRDPWTGCFLFFTLFIGWIAYIFRPKYKCPNCHKLFD